MIYDALAEEIAEIVGVELGPVYESTHRELGMLKFVEILFQQF